MNSKDSNSLRHDNDFDWLAFCYVADELDTAARKKFEQRLADDSQACEAVARAVELSQLVHRAGQQGDSDSTGLTLKPATELLGTAGTSWKRFRPSPRLVFAASVLLTLLAVGWTINVNRTDSFVADIPSDDLAVTWVDSLTDPEDSDAAVDQAQVDLLGGAMNIEMEDDPLFSESVLAELDSQDNWMLIALAELEATNQ